MDGRPRILITGGGYGGMHTAMRLERLLRPGEATVMIADPRSYMTYQPLLAEAAAGNLEARHIVVPLRRAPTGMPSPGQWSAWTCTAASRRSTGCGCAASPPGWSTAPTTC